MQQNQNPTVNNSPDASNGAPSSEFVDDFMNQLNSPSKPSAPAQKPALENKKLFILAGVAVFVIIILIVLNLVLGNRQGGNESTEETNETQFYDITESSETLNSSLEQSVAKNPHMDYQTTLSYTPYLQDTPSQLCQRFSISCSSLAYPESVDQAVRALAMNSNALNYHLDNGQIVIISAKGQEVFSPEGTVLVVYAANYDFPIYQVFNPQTGNLSEPTYLSRSELFSDIDDVADFYTISQEEK